MDQRNSPLGNIPVYRHLASAAVVHAQSCIGKDRRLDEEFAAWNREWADWDPVEAIVNHELLHTRVISVLSRKKTSRFRMASISGQRTLHICNCIEEEEKIRLEERDMAGIAELLSTILNDLEGKSYRRLFALTGTEAQGVVDLLYSLIKTPSRRHLGDRRLFTDALFKLAQKSGCYPQILLLKDVKVSQNDPIGIGGFGTVYQGQYQGQSVAVKHLRDFSSKRAQKCARELVIWACMEHPNVLSFYGVYLLNGLDASACLVSPLMENGNLVQYLAQSPDVSRESLLYDISLGMEYLHAQSIIHGDMKPENVFVALDGRACIGDYGLASVNSASQNWTTKSRSLNSGTLRYQAPELFKDAQINRETDMYAFGCIIYEVVTGNRPYYRYIHDVAVLTAVIGGEPMTSLDELPETQGDLRELCMKCIDRDPGQRPAIGGITKRLHAMIPTRYAPQGVYADKNLAALLLDMFRERRRLPAPRISPASGNRLSDSELARASLDTSSNRKVSVISTLRFPTPNGIGPRTTPSSSASLSSVSNVKKAKVLLLGGGESGKTTFKKQLQFIQQDFHLSKHEIQSYSETVLNSFTEDLRDLYEAVQNIDSSETSARLSRSAMDSLLYVTGRGGTYSVTPDLSVLSDIYKEDCVQQIFRTGDRPYSENLRYFLPSIERIFSPSYKATLEDIIHCRVRTLGLDQNELILGDLTLSLVDTGGQIPERRKWIHCFSGTDFVVFFVNLAGYDQTLFEDNTLNQMKDALVLWESICRTKYLGSSTLILLFNKRDIYEEKILFSDISTHFPDFTGPAKDAEAGITFFAKSFLDLFFSESSPPERQIFVHTVSAIHNDILDVVMSDVRARMDQAH